MRTTIALLSLLLFASDAGAYVKDPEGRLIGLLVDPKEKQEPPRPSPCRLRREVAEVNSHLARMLRELPPVVKGERAFGRTLGSLAGLYDRFPEKSKLLHGLALTVMTPSGDICSYIDGLVADLQRAAQCVKDPKYVQKQCTFIPRSCLDEKAIEAKFRAIDEAMTAVYEDLMAQWTHTSMLVSGLPRDHLYRMDSGEILHVWEKRCIYKDELCPKTGCKLNCTQLECTASLPLCRQHMASALGVLVLVQGPDKYGKTNGLIKALREASLKKDPKD